MTFLTIDNSENKYNILCELLSNLCCSHIIIYTNSDEESKLLKNNLEKDFYQVAWLNNLMDEYAQNYIIHNFVNKSETRILIT